MNRIVSMIMICAFTVCLGSYSLGNQGDEDETGKGDTQKERPILEKCKKKK